MTIKVGDQLPDVEVRIMKDGNVEVVSSRALLGSGKAVLFGVPGAFTPGCSKQHLPGFVARAADISGKGVGTIACVGVNDIFVMDAWGQAQGVGDSIVMVADGAGAFAKAIGTDVDHPALGLRSKRYAMVIEDGVVTAFLPEEDGFSVDSSTAECVIDAL